MLDEECQARLNEIIEDSSDAGFEFEAPESLADAKNKVAKQILFYLENIQKEFDIGRWNDRDTNRFMKASSYFFKMIDKWTLTKETPEIKTVFEVKKPTTIKFEVEKEIDKNVKTLNEWRVKV